MSTPSPRTPDDLAAACATRFDRRYRRWLADTEAATGESVRFATAPPASRRAAEHPAQVSEWSGRWRDFDAASGESTHVEWSDRRLPGFGVVALPQRVVVTGAREVATVAGRGEQWSRLTGRVERLLELAGDKEAAVSEAVRRAAADTAAVWEDWPPGEIDHLVSVCRWALEHSTHGLRAREIAVPGVDTKWIESHRRVVETLLDAARDAGDDEIPCGLGLRDADARVRIRVLDLALGFPLTDVESPVGDLSRLWQDVGPDRVLVVENLTTFLAMPSLPRTVAVFGRGFAVDIVATLPWVRCASVVYWGDLDSHGFAILDRLRAHLPAMRSVLMDLETVSKWQGLAVPDYSPTRTALPRLTTDESKTLDALTIAGDLRLEQERIPWDWALPRVEAAWDVEEDD